MKDGIIYPITQFIIKNLDKLNLVELFKYAGKKLNTDKANKDRELAYARTAADLFIILKFLFILLLLVFGVSARWATVVVWYLITANLYTYFYRHVWHDSAFRTIHLTMERQRRKFLNLLLAFIYSNLCFAYLYYLPYSKQMNWGQEASVTFLHSFWFSMSNSIAANYSVVLPLTGFGNSIAMIQLVITFIFITIILSRSVPQSI